MNTGRIIPSIRAIVTERLSPKKTGNDSSANGREQYQQQKEKEPSKEEVLEALNVLQKQESFAKSGISAELSEKDGKFFIVVRNAAGTELKQIRGFEIFRIIALGADAKSAGIGRILDRRI